METEIAVKSEHIRNLKAQIDKLESDKGAIEDWVRSKEKYVDDLQTKAKIINEGIAKEKAGLEVKKKEIEEALNTLKKKNEELDRKIHSNSITEETLKNLKEQNDSFRKNLDVKKDSLDSREVDLVKRESFVKSIFDGIEKLR